MPPRKKFKSDDRKDAVRINERIRVSQILVVHEGKKLGIMQTRDALYKARGMGLDLVEVAAKARPPVCQIMDYGKYKYEKNKKARNKKSTVIKEKEISFRYVIGDHDLETKANQARKFLTKGNKVKLIVKFKSREKAHKDEGFKVIEKILGMLEDVASIDKAPGFEGHNITAKLDLKKEAKNELEKARREAEKDS